MKLFRTVCNSYLVNSYILSDHAGNAILIDPACCNRQECGRIVEFVEQNRCRIGAVWVTHPHADHVMGCRLIADAFPQATLWMHEESLDLYQQVNDYAMLMGFSKIADIPQPDGYLKDADVRKLGELTLQILHTPGHAPGSICIYCPEAEIVFTGDVLFKDSIGRTDLQGGSFDVLQDMIQTKLFTLPQQTVVLPGHGDQTTIGYEQQYNPFLRSTH